EQFEAIEEALPSSFEVKFAFNQWTLGEGFCKEVLGLSEEQLANPQFNILKHLGYSDEEIQEANDYVGGTMTVEGAQHLKNERHPVLYRTTLFGRNATRYIETKAQMRMIVAIQPLVSGAISKTINLPNEATEEDFKHVSLHFWQLKLKSNTLYRNGSKPSQ